MVTVRRGACATVFIGRPWNMSKSQKAHAETFHEVSNKRIYQTKVSTDVGSAKSPTRRMILRCSVEYTKWWFHKHPILSEHSSLDSH